MPSTMPRKSQLQMEPLRFGKDESLGQRLARIRKSRGYTQQELAERVGSIQVLVSDYERDKLRLSAEMAIRFAHALEVTTDELLGMTEPKTNGHKPSRKILRRLEKIDTLRPQQQAILLKTIDTFLRGATK